MGMSRMSFKTKLINKRLLRPLGIRNDKLNKLKRENSNE